MTKSFARIAWGIIQAVLFAVIVHAQPEAVSSDADKAAYWIERLADSDFDVRTRATIELCKLGPAAVPTLERAAKDSPPEVAFRAQHLLETLANLYFAGAEITLTTSKTEVDWNQAFDLIVSIRNPTSYSVRLPFAKSDGAGSANSAAAQVSAMFDVADMLYVTGPEGEPISLHVDDIRQDAAVTAVVEHRLTGGEDSILLPGASVELRIPDFNRGWARFPLLKSGKYHIHFVYEPEWNEAALQDAKTGVVEAKPCQVEVGQSAPETISGPEGPCQLATVVNEKFVELQLINRYDVDVHVNLNLGSSLTTFATLQLRLLNNEELASVDLGPLVGADGKYLAARVVPLKAGEKISLAKLDLGELGKRFADLKVADISAGMVQFEYVNLIDAAWQRERGDPAGVDPELLKSMRSQPLPARMLTGRVVSESLPVSQIARR